MTLYAFGLDPPIASWSNQRGASNLLGTSAADFVPRLLEVLESPDNQFVWNIAGFQWDTWKKSERMYEYLNLQGCGYTNWEMWEFNDRPEVWARTTWWDIVDGSYCEVSNPLEVNDD